MLNDDRGVKDGGGVFVGRIQKSVAGQLLRLSRRLARRAVRAHRRRVALRELEALDDRLLKDIGLSRGLLPFQIERMLIEHDEKGRASVPAPREVFADDGLGAATTVEEPFRRAA